jgi:hypothetical protein
LEEDEPEVAPEKPVKAAAKKAAGATKKLAAVPEPEQSDTEYTEEELNELTPTEVKALAAGMGITSRGKDAQVKAILAAGSANGVSTTTYTTGGSDAVVTYTTTTGTALSGWGIIPAAKVLVAVIDPSGTTYTKLVDRSAVDAL